MAMESQDASSAIILAEFGVVTPVRTKNSIRLGVVPFRGGASTQEMGAAIAGLAPGHLGA